MNSEEQKSGQRLRDLKFVVATRMLDHMSISMYSKYPKAIGELVVNGYDADANYVNVIIQPNKDTIIIEDNGEGMDENAIRQAYMFLGSAQKRVTARTPIYHRLPIGNKGIGKLAGFGIAKRIELKTTKDEKTYEFCMDRDNLEASEKMGKLKEAILDRASMGFIVFDAKGQSNGTTVTLKKLRPECGRLDIDKVIAHLAHELPLGKDFKVMVNGHTCEPKDIPSRRKIHIDYNDPICGQIIGEIILATKMLQQPGIFTTVRGRVVGEPSLFGLSISKFRYHVGDLITGSVEVPGFDPEDRSDEMPVIKTDREGFIETHQKYVAYTDYMKKILNDICREEERKYQEKEEIEKKAKVDEAIKKVAEDLNAYDDLFKQKSRQDKKINGKVDPDGQKVLRPDLNIESKRSLERKAKEHPPISPDIMKEINAILGSGRLRFKNQNYEIKPKALGAEWPECDIRLTESLILINLDHPAYEQGILEECIEIVVFRAIAARFARDESESSIEMYEKLDDMIRFQAERMQKRKGKNKNTSQEFIDLNI
ncbi:MAG: ATP-binding protein [Dehalococcoidales bacterium]|nr:ATP-binding protein [Dehalococcoidales bacterium]